MAFVIVRIAPCGAGQPDYAVTLIEEGGQETAGVLTKADMESGRWKPNNILKRVIGVNSTDRNHPDFADIARTLYDWLLPDGPVRQRWIALDKSINELCLWLDIQADTLARLPWELTSTDRLALTNGLYRFTPEQPVSAPGSSWPFRILIVVGCSAQEETALGIADEVRKIERTFLGLGRSVDVQRVDRPDKVTLKDWVQTFHPHVLHFAGHGRKQPGPDGKIGLLFDLPENNSWIWSGSDIRTDLKSWRWIPRFVFLNACRSAAEQDEKEGNWSVQRAFLARGTQAALGMQADMRGDLAGQFAAALYDQCVEGKTLEGAVFEARNKVVPRNLPSNDYIDWALPVLAATAQNIKLFELPSLLTVLEFEQCREFREARFFANCRELRRKFTHWVYPADQTPSAENVLVVTGEPKSGKSHLLKWCMETWALGGARVRYIELHGQSKSLLDVLRQIRKGEPDGTIGSQYLHDPLPAAAFRRFKWELKNLIETNETGEWIEGDHINDPEIPDDDGILPAKGEKRLEPIVCARFWAALKAAAGARPLILVFDRLGGPNNERTLLPSDFEQLILYLFRPIGQETNSIIKVAFSASSSEARDYKLDLLPESNTVKCGVPVDFTDDQLAELAAEAVWFRKADKVKQVAISLFGFSGDDTRGLGRLKSVLDAIKSDPIFDGVRMR